MDFEIRYEYNDSGKYYALADIEIYIDEEEVCTGLVTTYCDQKIYGKKYWTGFKVSTNLFGMMAIAQKKIFNIKKFIDDFEKIKEFSNWLNDEDEERNYRFDNIHDASTVLYVNHLPELKRRLQAFCDKYGFYYNED